MATRSQKFKLGVFLTVAGVLFVVTIAVFAGMQMFASQDRYHVLFEESISGLELGSPVKLRGVRVGEVTKIRLNPDNVEQVQVTMLLAGDTPVKQDTAALVQMQGITGLKYIELSEGTRDSKPLEKGGYIKPGESLVSKVSDRADSLSLKVDKILDNMLVLTGEQNQKRIGSTLAHVESMVRTIDEMSANLNMMIKQLNELLTENREPIRNVLANADDTTERVNTLVGNANSLIVDLRGVVEGVRLEKTIAGIDETNSMIQKQFADLDLRTTVTNVSRTLAGLQLVMAELTKLMGQNQDELRAAMYNLRLATQSIKEFSRSVEEQPSSLIFDSKPKPRKLP